MQVRDFLFSPDDGRIAQLIVDALGIPALPERLLGCLGVRIQLVNSISFNCISLRPGAEVYVDKISPGAFDGAVELLKVRHTSLALILFSCLFSCHCDMPWVILLGPLSHPPTCSFSFSLVAHVQLMSHYWSLLALWTNLVSLRHNAL